MIKDYSQKYETYFNENFTKWNSAMGLKIDSYQPTVVSYFVNQRQAAEYLTIWLKARINGLEVAFNNFYS
mgnify:CR=1 FL=1